MNAFCTCGAQLPENALFCHRCGKPQREDLELAPEQVVEVPVQEPLLPVVSPPQITFSNRPAVRISLLCAGGASLLMSVPFGVFTFFWFLLLLISAGFLSVYLYHRRSGTFLTVRSGARMGWMTGLFCYLVAMVVFTINIAILASGGKLSEVFREQIQSQSNPDASVQEALRLLESPAGMAVLILFTLALMFFLFTSLPMIGGALSAKVLEREQSG